MEREKEIIQEEIKALIVKSCEFEEHPIPKFCDFHKDFLKFTFEAVRLSIDYEAKKIYTSNSKPLTTNPVRLFNMNEALADVLSYTDLEETLLGCLKTDHLHTHRYKLFLQEYSEHPFDDSSILYA